jgi:hypothetical protein
MSNATNVKPVGFTLKRIANATLGLPPDAPVLIRMPDGQMRQIEHIAGHKLAQGAAGGAAAPEGQYAVVLVLGP